MGAMLPLYRKTSVKATIYLGKYQCNKFSTPQYYRTYINKSVGFPAGCAKRVQVEWNHRSRMIPVLVQDSRYKYCDYKASLATSRYMYKYSMVHLEVNLNLYNIAPTILDIYAR